MFFYDLARRLPAAAVAIAAMAMPLSAQPLDDSTVGRIVGSDVKEEETTAAADEDKVVAAIDRTSENIGAVRKTTNVNQVDIVFLKDTARTEGGPTRAIAEKIEQHRSEIAALRQEIEANALLYHAIDSRRVLVEDVLAVDFEGAEKVVIYAAAKPAD